VTKEHMKKLEDRFFFFRVFPACGDGWFILLWALCLEIDKLKPDEDFRFTDVKEKFGTLNVYCNFVDPEIDRLIEAVERKSAKVCESCGEDGRLLEESHWISCRCERCEVEERR
jgi:hypothetical protein